MSDDLLRRATFTASAIEYARSIGLFLEGELDRTRVADLRRSLAGIEIGVGRHVTVDVSRLRFLDVAAFGELERLRQSVEALDGEFAVVGARGAVRRVFDLAGRTSLLAAEPA